MSKKDWLMRYQRKAQQAEKLKEKIETLQAEAERTTSRLDGMPVGGKENHQEATIARLSDLKDTYRRVEEEAAAARLEILSAISYIENLDSFRILTMRYIHGMKWGEIAEQTDRNERYILRLHKQALDEFDCSGYAVT